MSLSSEETKTKHLEMYQKPDMYNVAKTPSATVTFKPLLSPNQIYEMLPMSPEAANTVNIGKNTLKNILMRKDHRFIVVVGPCSIHDTIAGFDYAKRLKKLSDELSDTLCIVMRVYFEKPRTTVGWKGFINDPCMDGTSKIDIGIKKARQFLLAINELGLPIATEILDPNSPRYFEDLLSWIAIGARTVESQIHREFSSGLNTPVGFKNGTDGSLKVAVNAMLAAARPHSFIGTNMHGQTSIIHTQGNCYGHLVLRGSCIQPNYDAKNVAIAEDLLASNNLAKNIIIDCSHGNSLKDYQKQETVLADIIEQIKHGNQSIIGCMLESNIEAGSQEIPKDLFNLKYGRSITDACIDWDTTEKLLRKMYHELNTTLMRRNKFISR